MDAAQAIHAFWSSFGLEAYAEDTVPETAELPYITYDLSRGAFEEPVSCSASIWYRSTSWGDVSRKADEVFREIKDNNKTIETDDGYVYIVPGLPFSRRLNDPDDDLIRRIYINVDVEYFE